MYVVGQQGCYVDVEVFGGEENSDVCVAFEDVACFFGEFVEDFVEFPNVWFGAGDPIVDIGYVGFYNNVKNVDFWFDGGQ